MHSCFKSASHSASESEDESEAVLLTVSKVASEDSDSAAEDQGGCLGPDFDARETAQSYVDKSYTRGRDWLPHTWVFVVAAIVLECVLFLVLWWAGRLNEILEILITVGSISAMIGIVMIPVVAFVIRHQQQVLEAVVVGEMLVVVAELQAALPRILKTFFENEDFVKSTLKGIGARIESEGKQLLQDSLHTASEKAWEGVWKTQEKTKEAMSEAVSMAIEYALEEGEFIKNKAWQIEEKAQAVISREVDKVAHKIWPYIEAGMNGEFGQKLHAFEEKAAHAIKDAMHGELGDNIQKLEDSAREALQEVMDSELGHQIEALEEKIRVVLQEAMKSEFGQKVYDIEEKTKTAIQAAMKSELAHKVYEFEQKAKTAIQDGMKTELAHKVYEFEDKARSAMQEGVVGVRQQLNDQLLQVLKQIAELTRRMGELEKVIKERG